LYQKFVHKVTIKVNCDTKNASLKLYTYKRNAQVHRMYLCWHKLNRTAQLLLCLYLQLCCLVV